MGVRVLVLFPGFRRLLAGIEALALTLSDLVDIQRELGPAADRLNALELSRHHFEAEMRAAVLRAESQYKATASSEQRERQLKKANERFTDPLSDEGQAPPEGHDPAGVAAASDVGTGSPEGVPPLHMVLATNNKAHAVRTKWGMQ